MKRIHRLRQMHGPRGSGGMSLIEVMVAVLVLAVGLLGIAAMQSFALRAGQGSLESTQAVMATNSIFEAMRANRAQAADYTMAKTCSVPSGGSVVATDKAQWMTGLKTSLGSGIGDTTTCGQIECSASGNCKVTVYWDDTRAGGVSDRSLVVEGLI